MAAAIAIAFWHDRVVFVLFVVVVAAAVKSFYVFHRRSLDPSVAKDVVAPEPKQRSPKMNDLVELDAAMFLPRDRVIV